MIGLQLRHVPANTAIRRKFKFYLVSRSVTLATLNSMRLSLTSNSWPPISWKNTLFSVVKQRAQHPGACSFDLDAADCFLELYTLIRNTRLRAETF